MSERAQALEAIDRMLSYMVINSADRRILRAEIAALPVQALEPPQLRLHAALRDAVLFIENHAPDVHTHEPDEHVGNECPVCDGLAIIGELRELQALSPAFLDETLEDAASALWSALCDGDGEHSEALDKAIIKAHLSAALVGHAPENQ